ncbi:hypothetical protein OIU77_012978, partial [Salix suchowensis]
MCKVKLKQSYSLSRFHPAGRVHSRIPMNLITLVSSDSSSHIN